MSYCDVFCCCVVDRLFYFCGVVVCTVWRSYAFCNSHYLFTLLFLSKQDSYGRKIVPSFSFCLYLVALNVCRASNVWGHECKSSCLLLQLESAEYLKRWRTALNEAGRSVRVNDNEETHIRELNSTQLTCNSNIHCLCTINSSTLDVGIIASVCRLPNSPS